jgi:hypothetical protein
VLRPHVLQFGDLDVLACLCTGLFQLGAIKVTSFENCNGNLAGADFIARKFEMGMALGHRTRGLDLCLGGLNLRMRTKNNPAPALWTGDARTYNAIGHTGIIGFLNKTIPATFGPSRHSSVRPVGVILGSRTEGAVFFLVTSCFLFSSVRRTKPAPSWHF